MKRLSFTGIAALGIVWILSQSSFASPVPDTGQTKCYNNSVEISCPQPGEPFYGQDAQYGTNTHSYTGLGNGVVRDNVTGLEWVKDGNLLATRDPAFDADDIAGDGRITWQHALDYVAKLNNENYLEHSDWRRPTVKELTTLVDSSMKIPGPTINTNYFPGTVAAFYWSATADANWIAPAASSRYVRKKNYHYCTFCDFICYIISRARTAAHALFFTYRLYTLIPERNPSHEHDVFQKTDAVFIMYYYFCRLPAKRGQHIAGGCRESVAGHCRNHSAGPAAIRADSA